MITRQQRDEIKNRLAERERIIDARSPECRKSNGWIVLPQEVQEQLPVVTNEERSAVEVFDFMEDPPEHYLAYVDEQTRQITTWVGDFLGFATFGKPFRSNFGDRRTPVRVHAINGHLYSGTYYGDSGSYCRLKRCK